jgi:hypothetical protein
MFTKYSKNVSDNITTRYLMIGDELPNSSSLILKGYAGEIGDILDLISYPEIDYCKQLSFPLNEIKLTGSLNEGTFVNILAWILGIGIQQEIGAECIVNALYGITMTTNRYSYLATDIYWQAGVRLIEKAMKLVDKNDKVAVVLSHYLKVLIENRTGQEEILHKMNSIIQRGHWIVRIVVISALILHAIVTHNKKMFTEIARLVKNYSSYMPSTGLILVAETGHLLFEACEAFGELYELEFWYTQSKHANDQLQKWGDSNPDLIEYLEYYHHFEHYENKRWLAEIEIRVLEIKVRLLIRNNELRNAERSLQRIFRIKKEKHLANEAELLWIEFKLMRLRILRSGFINDVDLTRIWERALATIRFFGRIAFLEILSTSVVFSDAIDSKKILTQSSYLLEEHNSLALITYGFFIVRKNEHSNTFFDPFIKFLKSYSNERRDNDVPNNTPIIDSNLSLSLYPEIQEAAPSLLTNSSGLVSLVLYGYLKNDQKLIQQLLKYAINQFGYIKIMESICKKLLSMASVGNTNSQEFQNNLLRLYFMRII